MGVRSARARRRRMVRVTVVGAAIVLLGAGGWSLAAAASPLPQLPLLGLPLPESAVPGQTYVTPQDLHGFGSEDPPGTGTREFSHDLGAPPMGNADALKLTTPDNDARAQFFTKELAGPLENFLSSSYFAKRSSESTAPDVQFPSFQIPVDKNGGEFNSADFSTLTFEPAYQSGDNANVTEDSWNKYDTGKGVFCSTRQIGGFEANQTRCDNGGTKTLAQIIEANPGITALAAGINQGRGNPGLISAVDLIQVGSTTYNFEQKAPLTPTPGGPGTPPGEPGTPTPPDCDQPTPGDGGSKDDHSKDSGSKGGGSKDSGSKDGGSKGSGSTDPGDGCTG